MQLKIMCFKINFLLLSYQVQPSTVPISIHCNDCFKEYHIAIKHSPCVANIRKILKFKLFMTMQGNKKVYQHCMTFISTVETKINIDGRQQQIKDDARKYFCSFSMNRCQCRWSLGVCPNGLNCQRLVNFYINSCLQ